MLMRGPGGVATVMARSLAPGAGPAHNRAMHTGDASAALARVFAELIDGTTGESAFVLNRGDIGLLKALDTLSAANASRAVNGGATIAAHAEHLRYGLSLMNRWAIDG